MRGLVFFQRRSDEGHFSIEHVFAQVRKVLKEVYGVDSRLEVCPFFSQGLWPRLCNLVYAWRRRGAVNHITGDVHYLALLLPKRRTVLTIHDCEALRRFKGLKRWVFFWLWFQLPVWRVARVTTVSAFTREDLLSLVRCDPQKVVVVPNMVAATFHGVSKAFETGCPRLLHVGTAHNKNLERVAEALSGLSCKLEIVGRLKEGQREVLERWKIDYENVWDLDETQMAEAYARCDMLLFASLYEGFGMPIIEVQRTGRPVVASRLCSMPDVAGERGACFVDPHSVRSIREGVERVIRNVSYREELVQAGFENVRRFEACEVVEQYLELYRELT